MDPVLNVRDVCLSYHTLSGETPALSHISFDLMPGEFLAVVGPSGCGKSTLLNLIAGLLTPESGYITLDGRPVVSGDPAVGYMLQKDQLLEWRTTQRIIVGYTAVRRAWKITPMLAASFASRQTGRRDWGILLGQRTAWNKGRHWKWRLLTVWFKTTDFASAIYVQKPDLLQSGLASAFAHHGTHLSTTLSYAPTEHLSAGVRLAMLRYFNQCSQSTGVMKINSPWKNDVALLVKYAF